MALVNIATILADTLRALKKIEPPGGIEFLSYKRNRTIAMIKREFPRSKKIRLVKFSAPQELEHIHQKI